ncbi:hypothetical protein D3C71_1166530 [compost metagenome]
MRGIERVVQQRVAVGIGLAAQHHFALAVDDLQRHLLPRRATGQRGGVHEQLVLVGARVQADVTDGEERRVEFVVKTAGALHHREVQAGLLQLLHFLDRQVGQHALVLLATEHKAVHVDRFGQLGQRRAIAVFAVQLPAAATAAALVLAEEVGQVFLAHAQEFDIHLRHVHRHHRQAAAVLGRQHAALRGKAHRRVQLTGEHLLPHLRTQAIAVGGKQVRGDDQRVFLGRFHIGIAQGLAVVGQRPAALVGADLFLEAQQLVELLGADQRPRELDGQRKAFTALLVGPGAQHREALDLFLLGHDGLARGTGQLTGFIPFASCNQGQRRKSDRRPPHTHRLPVFHGVLQQMARSIPSHP